MKSIIDLFRFIKKDQKVIAIKPDPDFNLDDTSPHLNNGEPSDSEGEKNNAFEDNESEHIVGNSSPIALGKH